MSMLMSIGGLIVVIALAATILKNPKQENKTLISVACLAVNFHHIEYCMVINQKKFILRMISAASDA